MVSTGIKLFPEDVETRRAAKKHGVLQNNGTHIKLKGDLCAALKEGECVLHEVKPMTCKLFPFFPVRRGVPLLEGNPCNALDEHIRAHPENLVTIKGRLLLMTDKMGEDEMLSDSLDLARRYHGIRKNLPIAITTIDQAWFDDPVIGKRIKELQAQGLRISKKIMTKDGLISPDETKQ